MNSISVKCNANDGIAFGFKYIGENEVAVGWHDGTVSFLNIKTLDFRNVIAGKNAIRCFGSQDGKIIGVGDDGNVWIHY